MSNTRLIPVAQWEKYHPWPTKSGLQGLIINRETNGFASVVKKLKKRVLIDEKAFFQWVEEQNKIYNK